MVIFSGAAIRGFFRHFHAKVALGGHRCRGGSLSEPCGVGDVRGRRNQNEIRGVENIKNPSTTIPGE